MKKIRDIFLIIIIVLLLCDNRVFAHTDNFDEILLVVHYNHPYYQTAEFIKELYASFPNIVFYGEAPNSNTTAVTVPVHVVTTQTGFFLSKVVADALSRYPDYRGYIFMQDDVLMNIWNFSRLDRDKIWFAPRIRHYNSNSELSLIPVSWNPGFDKNQTYDEFFNPIRDKAWPWFWTGMGLSAIDKAVKKLKGRDRRMLRKNLKPPMRIGMVCDMFYIPKIHRTEAIRLSNIYKDVFCEMAIPMTLASLDVFKNWEFLKGVWEYYLPGGGVDFEDDSTYPLEADWVHPLKFSKINQQKFALRLMQKYN